MLTANLPAKITCDRLMQQTPRELAMDSQDVPLEAE
jgi:hypothetical protein